MTRRPRRSPILLVGAGVVVLLVAAGCAPRRTALERGAHDQVSVAELRALRPLLDHPDRTASRRTALGALVQRRVDGGPRAVGDELAIEALIAWREFAPEPDDAVPPALALLKDENRVLRYYALRVLALHPEDPRARPVIAALKADADPLLSGEAALILP